LATESFLDYNMVGAMVVVYLIPVPMCTGIIYTTTAPTISESRKLAVAKTPIWGLVGLVVVYIWGSRKLGATDLHIQGEVFPHMGSLPICGNSSQV
jgi:hypothetical protein